MITFAGSVIGLLFCLAGAYAADEVVVSTETAIDVPAPEPYVCPLGVGRCVVVAKCLNGVCLRIKPGQTVRAARSGRVIFAGFSKEYVSRANKKEQHRLIIVRHADGQSSRYVHLNTLSVRSSQNVKPGDALGTAAESDEVKEPVLHFEIRAANGVPLDAGALLKQAAGGA
jgi:murein DD-endopeptidase MepM/ murein hydrolase activator NlpD